MDRLLVPATYAQRLSAYLAGGPVEPLLNLFREDAVIERYIYGEPPRTFAGIEQIEESLLHLPPVGGTFHAANIYVEEDTVHARFHTHGFPFPMRGLYRFELGDDGRIARLYIAARYTGKSRRDRE